MTPALIALANEWMPRLLTQIDRDPTSATYGCADRNWWHYKIRDYSSIILQQGACAVGWAGTLPSWRHEQEPLIAVSRAGALFWSAHLGRHRSFDEYYPWEQGYPPAAFSTLAVLRAVAAGWVAAEDVAVGAQVAAKQLSRRFEAQAANQQMAGLAALCWLHRLYPELISAAQLQNMVDRTLALQTAEGWYPEYDGPDLGYLSVTIDCLWDAYDATQDDRLIDSARSAVTYIEHLTRLTGAGIGMHNARNTDYLVPYGICRMALEDEGGGAMSPARLLVDRLFESIPATHFLRATDDRYVSHYIGASLLRAAGLHPSGSASSDVSKRPSVAEPASRQAYALSGHVVEPDALIALHKGGLITMRSPSGALATDCGWAFEWRNQRYVTHWWSRLWQTAAEDGAWHVEGYFVPTRSLISSPLKHMVLRLASRLFGAGLIRHLKAVMIFRKPDTAFPFRRTIRRTDAGWQIEDTMPVLPAGVTPDVAPRASRRHVASADSFHPEDLSLTAAGWTVERVVEAEGSGYQAYIWYRWGDKEHLDQ
jgi:hypothetical protein